MAAVLPIPGIGAGITTIVNRGTMNITGPLQNVNNAHVINYGTLQTNNPALLMQFANITNQGNGVIEGPANYQGTLIADLNAGETFAVAIAKPGA